MIDIKRRLAPLLSAFCIVLAAASHAFANNAPGPLAVVSLFSLVILIVALTSAGGGYSVVRRLHDAKYPSKVKRTIMNTLEFIAGVILFFAGIMSSILGVAGFSLYAIGRGVKMIKWSRDAEKEGARPAHLEGANPKRLKIAGIMLIVLTLLLFGYSLLNLDEVTGINPDWRNKGRVAQLSAEARNAKTAAEIYLFDHPKAKVVTCEDLVKAGFVTRKDITCFSDLTATSGSIRLTGPDSWKLKNPVAVITYKGELTPAEP
ncbi:MAG: hypothetical protein AABZ15_03285 [Nitrospirota bacterium]